MQLKLPFLEHILRLVHSYGNFSVHQKLAQLIKQERLFPNQMQQVTYCVIRTAANSSIKISSSRDG